MRLLSEWHPQEAVLLAWPDNDTDWAPWLSAAQETYVALIEALNSNGTGVVLLIKADQTQLVRYRLSSQNKVLLVESDYNDTWTRDYGFLTVQSVQGKIPINFVFNGWGNKFSAEKDSMVNDSYLKPLCKNAMVDVDIVLEGGALEINEAGELLSTEFCLSNPQRNGSMSSEQYQETFQKYLGASTTTLFKNGHLEGDDTDAHIDTLVRFTPRNDLVIQACNNRPEDPHFTGLQALVSECHAHFPHATIFELPLPNIFNEAGERLPASYANFLLNNGQVLLPYYGVEEDEIALSVLKEAFPGFSIKPINCQTLLQQFGSLHCITMQIPQGTFREEIVAQLNNGVSIYAS